MGLRIAVSALHLRPAVRGGAVTFFRELVSALSGSPEVDEVLLVGTVRCHYALEGLPVLASIVPASWNRPGSFVLRKHLENLHPDVVHSFGGWMAPKSDAYPTVGTLFDFQEHYIPSAFNRRTRIGRHVRHKWNNLNSEVHTVISPSTLIDAQRLYSIPMEKLVLTPLGVNRPTHFGTSQYPGVIVYPASFASHKNHVLLAQALSLIKKSGRKPPRVLCFGLGTDSTAFMSIGRDLGVSDSFIGIGHVSDAEKWALLWGSSALAFPSRFEGFGLPLVEAQSINLPIIAADSPGVRETVEQGHCLLSPNDPSQWAQALLKFGSSTTQRSLSPPRFTWDVTAYSTLQAYYRALGFSNALS